MKVCVMTKANANTMRIRIPRNQRVVRLLYMSRFHRRARIEELGKGTQHLPHSIPRLMPCSEEGRLACHGCTKQAGGAIRPRSRFRQKNAPAGGQRGLELEIRET